jgi:hypothetical protein
VIRKACEVCGAEMLFRYACQAERRRTCGYRCRSALRARERGPDPLEMVAEISRCGGSAAEQADSAGLALGSLYVMRSRARAAGHAVASLYGQMQDDDEEKEESIVTGCARCGLRGEHVCLAASA